MPKKIAELGPLDVRRRSKIEGFHNVGGTPGLHLSVRGEASSWVLRVVVDGRRRDIGVGSFPSVSLADARTAANILRAEISAGRDPLSERRSARIAIKGRLTFDQAARKVVEIKGQAWRNPKHRAQWLASLDAHASPHIGSTPVDRIALADVLAVLTPIWHDKHETASRVRQRIEAVLDWAAVMALRTGPNPARWKGNLDAALASTQKVRKVHKVKHHRALPYGEMSAFLPRLRAQDGLAARALEFVIYTAARSGEVRFARWTEIDMEAGHWTIPAERMKAGKEHRVPLPKQAIALLKALPRFDKVDLVFPSPTMKPYSDMSLSAVMRRMEVDAVPHGFRSSFRDWAGEETAHPSDVIEMALAHVIKDKTVAAYQRGDLFEKRRTLMADWGKFVTQPKRTGNVTSLASRRKRA